MARAVVMLALAALALAGCGGNPKPKACANQQRALATIQHDLAALRSARTHDAASAATDRFLLHVETAPLSNLQRNRLIDHAAAAVASKCPDCFQALEAGRPIPAIRQGDLKCSS